MSQEIFYLNGRALKYQTAQDYDDDCIKTDHELVDAKTGEHVKSIDWSPYGCPGSEDIRLYLELGCPRREEIPTIGPINREDLVGLKVKRENLNLKPQQLEFTLF